MVKSVTDVWGIKREAKRRGVKVEFLTVKWLKDHPHATTIRVIAGQNYEISTMHIRMFEKNENGEWELSCTLDGEEYEDGEITTQHSRYLKNPKNIFVIGSGADPIFVLSDQGQPKLGGWPVGFNAPRFTNIFCRPFLARVAGFRCVPPPGKAADYYGDPPSTYADLPIPPCSKGKHYDARNDKCIFKSH
jgi:hypothetical protein